MRGWRGGNSFYNRIISNAAGFDGIAHTRSG
jgi:hypothetical protein